MEGISDRELRERLIESPRDGWRIFIDQYTPTLVTLIEQAGVHQYDEAMDVYVRVCDHLAENECARLRRYDPAKGRVAGWLTVVVRRVMVDWIRARKGRRRLFGSIRALGRFDRRVFELYYWRGYTPGEIMAVLAPSDASPTLTGVFDALGRIEAALSNRQRAELLSIAARTRDLAALEDEDGRSIIDPEDPRGDPEQQLQAREIDGALAAALADLPAEDALIVSMRYIDGLSQAQVERALHIAPPLTSDRMRGILARLHASLEARGVGRRESATGGLAAEKGRQIQ